jgi:hypothetical protein
LAPDPLTGLPESALYLYPLPKDRGFTALSGKFTPAQHRINLQVTSAPPHLEIQIGNTGIIIPPAEQKRVFEKFYRLPSSDPRRRGGTGLGLALVQQRVNLLQGKIYLNSEADHTCFTLRLPRLLSVSGQQQSAQPRA